MLRLPAKRASIGISSANVQGAILLFDVFNLQSGLNAPSFNSASNTLGSRDIPPLTRAAAGEETNRDGEKGHLWDAQKHVPLSGD